MEEKRPLQSIPDDELLQRLGELVGQARRVEADVVAHIAEVEERMLHAREAFPSMFSYCTDVLHFSEAEAYLRIAAARASRKHPVLLTMLSDGRLHLTAIGLLAPHLTRESRDGLLERATHRSKREILVLLAEIAPRPDVPTVVRRLPSSKLHPLPSHKEAPMAGLCPDAVAMPELGDRRDDDVVAQATLGGDATLVAASAPRVSPTIVQPLSPGRYKVQFTASAELHDKLERLRSLVGSKEKDDLAAIIEQAVTEKLERLERRFARTSSKVLAKPVASISPSSRHIPAAVQRAVRARDGNRCRYVDDQGRRCPARDRLEFHHRHPFGLGGGHSVDNIRLLCHAHNAYLAEHDFGKEAMAKHRRRAQEAPEATPV